MNESQTKLQGYAASLYARMEREAVDNVWNGKIVDTCISLGIPQGGYNRVVNALRKMDCIQQTERGYRGSVNSVFILKRPPTIETWEAAFVKSREPDLTKRPSLDILRGRIGDVEKLIGGINVVEAFKNHEERLTALERKLKALEGQQENKPH